MKFIGSKLRLRKDLAPILQRILDKTTKKSYVEPFVGGANMIEVIEAKKKTGYDNNEYLVEMWKCLQRGWKIPENITREEYLAVKENKESYPKEYVAIVGFCATYNAKWFDGYAGIVHTKAGTVRNYYDEAKRNIEKQVPKVLDVDFIHKDYRDLKLNEEVVYCDPPYKTRRTRKDLYGESFNHEEYYDWVRTISENNIVLCSEYFMPDDFVCIFEKGMPVHFDNRELKERKERLFIYKKSPYLEIVKNIVQEEEND